jgi:Spy/CpxP family protein refolding chaperone
MNPQRIITALAATLVLASTTVWLLAQERFAPAPLTEQQLQRIRPIIQGTQAETTRAQTRLVECQRELAALYARYDLDEAAASKLREEIVDLQRQLLTSHHRLQKALRAVVTAEQFERLRRRLEQAATLHPAAGGQPIERPEAPPTRQP